VNEERAKRLLRHYIRMVWQAAGLVWDSDNDAEVDDIVDCLIAASVAEMETANERDYNEPSPAAIIAALTDAGRYQERSES
jgi:hypothetical protein